MDRRSFLSTFLTSFATGVVAGCRAPLQRAGEQIITVSGPIPASALGVTLPHEHVLVDFIGADQVSQDRYDRAEAFSVALPYLRQLRTLGCRTLFECTPAYLGRDPLLLRQLSEASGMHIVTNTGYYGARDDQHLPLHAFSETADQLAARWVQEFREGIDGTGIRPGFMKIGVDVGRLSSIDRKLIRAAARTHLQTGLTMAVHTGPAEGAFDQLAVLQEEGVDPRAWVWVHAQAEQDGSAHVEAARRGAWVEFDGVSPDSVERHVNLVLNMKTHGLLDHVLVSHDAGWYHVGEPGGGAFRGFNTVFDTFLPVLQDAGMTNEDVHLLTVTNPARAFSVQVRRDKRS